MRTFINMPLQSIQIWVRWRDLIPTETPIMDYGRLLRLFGENGLQAGREELGCPNFNAAEYYPQFLRDIQAMNRLHGVPAPKYQLLVHPNGLIGDGNFRYHWWRWAGLEFLPINLNYLVCNTSDLWYSLYPGGSGNMRGKEETTFGLPQHIKYEGEENWWELEARHFLKGKIKRGPPDDTFNMSYEACKARLKT